MHARVAGFCQTKLKKNKPYAFKAPPKTRSTSHWLQGKDNGKAGSGRKVPLEDEDSRRDHGSKEPNLWGRVLDKQWDFEW